MYQQVLVPLDGSALAECAIPEVVKLAKGGVVGEVILFRVIEIASFNVPAAYERGVDFAELRKAHHLEADHYLKGVQERLRSLGVAASIAMLEGRPAETIIGYAKSRAVDLIVIGTHGYTGLRRLMFGSVALRVLHDAQVPVLLVRPAPGAEKQ